METPNLGIAGKDLKKLSAELGKFLADTYTLYLKTQNFHWNVTGPFFHSLHEMFEEEYRELAEAVDVLAEQIRFLGGRAPGSFKTFLEINSLRENETDLSAEAMVKELMNDHETMVRHCQKLIATAAEMEAMATADLITKRMESHEKTAWMLRSTIQ